MPPTQIAPPSPKMMPSTETGPPSEKMTSQTTPPSRHSATESWDLPLLAPLPTVIWLAKKGTKIPEELAVACMLSYLHGQNIIKLHEPKRQATYIDFRCANVLLRQLRTGLGIQRG